MSEIIHRARHKVPTAEVNPSFIPVTTPIAVVDSSVPDPRFTATASKPVSDVYFAEEVKRQQEQEADEAAQQSTLQQQMLQAAKAGSDDDGVDLPALFAAQNLQSDQREVAQHGIETFPQQ